MARRKVIVAWGAVNRYVARKAAFPERLYAFRQLVGKRKLYCIGRTKSGAPLHPSRTAYTDIMQKWTWNA